MRSQISVTEAAKVLKRGVRRVYQLLESGDLEAGDFQGSVMTVSVTRYKRKIDNGTVRRGRPRTKGKGKR